METRSCKTPDCHNPVDVRNEGEYCWECVDDDFGVVNQEIEEFDHWYFESHPDYHNYRFDSHC